MIPDDFEDEPRSGRVVALVALLSAAVVVSAASWVVVRFFR